MKFKMNDSLLLWVALEQMKISKQELLKLAEKKYKLNDLTLIGNNSLPTNKLHPKTKEKLYQQVNHYTNGDYLIDTTQYNRILHINKLKSSKSLQPNVIVKKKKKIIKPE